MRTVLVCVRTPLAAQRISAVATRLGLASALRTAASAPEVMLRLGERPADVVLADTALTRPDPAGFTRRVLARSPEAAVVLFGTEESAAIAAAMAAGARGLIAGDGDLLSAVAKLVLLINAPGRNVAAGDAVALVENGSVNGARRASGMTGSAPAATRTGTVAGGPAVDSDGGPTVVPVQRGDDVADGENDPAGATDQPQPRQGAPAAGANGPAGRDGQPAPGRPAGPNGAAGSNGAAGPDGRRAKASGPGPGEPAAGDGAGRGARVTLTEREMQVLVGMADGKSNAEIGRELFVSEDTVKTHARRLFRKLGARDRAHAVAAGFRAGLVA